MPKDEVEREKDIIAAMDRLAEEKARKLWLDDVVTGLSGNSTNVQRVRQSLRSIAQDVFTMMKRGRATPEEVDVNKITEADHDEQ